MVRSNLGERMARMEQKVTDVESAVNSGFRDIKTNLKDFKLDVQTSHDNLRTELKEFKYYANKKFASKRTEVIVYGMVTIILVFVFKEILVITFGG